MRSASAVALAVAVALTASGPAWAGTHDDAVKAFEEGRTLRDARDLDNAVRAFERSVALEPSIGAYYNLGIIREQLGLPRDAVEALRRAESLAREKGDPREKDAAAALAKVLETHNHVTLDVAADVAAAPGLQLVLDGEVVPPSQYSGEVFRGPVSHELTVSATGRKTLRVQARNREAIHVALGEPVASPLVPAPTSRGEWGWHEWTGVGLVGIGAAGIVISLVRVFVYLGDESRLDKTRRDAVTHCTSSDGSTITTCADRGASAVAAANRALQNYEQNERDAKDGAPLTIGLGVAGVLLAGGGAALFLTAPPARTAAASAAAARVRVVPRLGPRDGGLVVIGVF